MNYKDGDRVVHASSGSGTIQVAGINGVCSVAFDKAVTMLSGITGIHPINPFNIPCKNKTWAGYMKADIAELVACDYIYMLNGWWHSKGAIVEWILAKVLHIGVIYE
jgi:hypothetical protein